MAARGAYGSQLAGVRLAWMDEGACADPSLTDDQRAAYFWDGERSTRKREAALAAAARCGTCSQQAVCLTYAMTSPMPHGIWAGLDLEERRALAKQQAAGRAS